MLSSHQKEKDAFDKFPKNQELLIGWSFPMFVFYFIQATKKIVIG